VSLAWHDQQLGSLRSLLSFLQAKKDIRYHRSRENHPFQKLSEDNKPFMAILISENIFSCRLFQNVDPTTENIPDLSMNIFYENIQTRKKIDFESISNNLHP
jgi:hypothetical protein